MPQKRTGGRKKVAGSGKKRTGGGKKVKGSKPKKAKHSTKNKKGNPKQKNENIKESGENGIEKLEIVGNFGDEFKGGISGETSKENVQSINPTAPPPPAINATSKETNTQSNENNNNPILPPPLPINAAAAVIIKPKRIKDPSMIASKIQNQGIAASRSLQCSALIPPESFMMNRFGATFIPPQNFQSTSGETGKASTDESDTASTSGDDED
uniref:Uncharacterized protein n=1 Tax=Panagrolaimus davidi TaxID=227884 RepID=A0A914QGK1_9BILA